MHPRVLIVAAVPYNTRATSRSFDAYFHNWEKENLAQVFSHSKKPCKGHCGELFQITDPRLVKRWINRKIETGRIFRYDDLEEQWQDNDLEVGHGFMERIYRLGQKHTPFTHIMRGILWRKPFWCTRKLNEWLDAFQPECVFLAFSDDYFINWIALYVAEKYDIPIVSCIGDDYYFNRRKTLNPIYNLYKGTYCALIQRVLAHPGSAIYISDKIRDKYNREFHLDGETVYLTSDVQRRHFRSIDAQKPVITYFGNIRMGRNQSLRAIADSLAEIDSRYILEVYTNEADPAVLAVIKNHPHICYGGSIPYAQVMQKLQQSDINIIVEGFTEDDVDQSRYSLSTKAADALASGVAIFAYGSQECGVIEYMQQTDAAQVCTNRDNLTASLRELIYNVDLQKRYYENQIRVSNAHHKLDISVARSESVMRRAIQMYEKDAAKHKQK